MEKNLIAYQDDDLVIVNKPYDFISIPVHSWHGKSVTSYLEEHNITKWAENSPEDRLGVMSRLDVGTSGLMIVAKNEKAFYSLKELFANREIKKTYHGLVQGVPKQTTGRIIAPIGRHPNSKFKFAITTNGKESITDYTVLRSKQIELDDQLYSVSLLEFDLKTGRTHQIRVHLSSVGFTIVGDKLYGANPKLAEKLNIKRQWLHSKKVEFIHPILKKKIVVESEYPIDLQNTLT